MNRSTIQTIVAMVATLVPGGLAAAADGDRLLDIREGWRQQGIQEKHFGNAYSDKRDEWGLDKLNENHIPHWQWVDGTERYRIRQTRNSVATYWVRDQPKHNYVAHGTMKPTDHDDFIGVVFGYQAPAEGGNPRRVDFIVVDWKKQSDAEAGFRLARIRGMEPGEHSSNSPMWHHKDSGEDGLQIVDLKEWASTAEGKAQTGWAVGVAYEFTLIYTNDLIRFEIQTADEYTHEPFAERATIFELHAKNVNEENLFEQGFPEGRFGFYNYSQSGVEYALRSLSPIEQSLRLDIERKGNDGELFIKVGKGHQTDGGQTEAGFRLVATPIGVAATRQSVRDQLRRDPERVAPVFKLPTVDEDGDVVDVVQADNVYRIPNAAWSRLIPSFDDGQEEARHGSRRRGFAVWLEGANGDQCSEVFIYRVR